MANFLKLKWEAFRISRICPIMIIACLSLKAQAKNYPIDRLIEIKVHKVSVKDAFNIITKQTGIIFTYSNDQFDENRRVILTSHNYSLRKILDEILSNTRFVWDYNEGNIIVKPIENSILKSSKVGQHELEPADSLVTLSGIVKDENGKPLPGVSIVVNNTKYGTSTNQEGIFVLKNVPSQSYITISSIGFTSQQFRVGNSRGWQSFILKESVSILDGAVVEAYSITSKRYSTSSISTISSKEIEKKPVTNVLLAMQGEIPGVIIQQSSGVANAGISVQIRGLNSLRKGSDPLYVVDGVPYTSQLMQTVNPSLGVSGDPDKEFAMQGNPLSFINPADIESISLLKDADATSIYGSRAAAGAILITTKKGKSGPTRFGVNFQQGFSKVVRFVDLLNRDQYLEMRHEGKINANEAILPYDYDLNGTWDTTHSTDWQKTLLGGTANYSDLQLTTSGGTENTQFLIGAGYNKSTSVSLASLSDQRGSIHFNISNISQNKKFNIQLSGSYMVDQNLPTADDLATWALTLPPVAPAIYNKDGSLNWAPDSQGQSSWVNPLASTKRTGRNTTNNLISNLLVAYNLAKGLKIKSSFGYTNMQINEYRGTPFSSYSPEDKALNLDRVANYSNGSIRSFIIEPQISYDFIKGDHRVDALLGSTIQNNRNFQQAFKGTGYGADQLLEDIRSASSVQVLSTVASTYKYNALFGRINYRFKDRYIINVAARRDGTSRFGANNRFHNFSSIGASWIFSEEPFFLKILKDVSFGKLQASYGTTGSDQIGDYLYLNTYASYSPRVPYQGVIGLANRGIPNPYLQWESTTKMQSSLDLGFFDNRILLNATYFLHRSSNQLVNYTLPALAGFSSYTKNLPAKIQNTGWELSGNFQPVKKKIFSWKFNINFYVPKNKLLSFPGIETSPYYLNYFVGQAITSRRVYAFAGVDPQTGLYQFYDYKGNLTASPNYKTDIIRVINMAPSYTAGLSNTLNYKNFQLDVLLQINKQYVASLKYGNFLPGTMINQPATILNRWRKPGDVNDIQRMTSSYSGNETSQYFKVGASDGNYMNCTYLRIKNVSFSWGVPQAWCAKRKVQYARFYINTQNLYTFTNFVGADPETGYSATLPPLRTITFGIQIGL
ncbi:SusC/RagA family TonB-linked outer membrane protein [Chitinophaga sancti]|uniref:SusC/RagA family TonB-linked outer membrane protein n=1 Tax=Chitinophaga sancti TaxID=1004 RepID=A0A1K1T2G4_9BACT|nr:SusC/RagA family TonB-linked outer membrane protein [Chitinophaga sancti]WQD59578.1 SusC/RagA family TonB-linked outer membrane protein [Chitinophaga sancti]WQG88288.1 SusC/RagA family TonB-linked outer membrane protein [Chitinophaga sancti]SFW90694.1 TonB-linked outer membrane protein, SusC/RagA family [Chitinophaga sancti]